AASRRVTDVLHHILAHVVERGDGVAQTTVVKSVSHLVDHPVSYRYAESDLLFPAVHKVAYLVKAHLRRHQRVLSTGLVQCRAAGTTGSPRRYAISPTGSGRPGCHPGISSSLVNLLSPKRS